MAINNSTREPEQEKVRHWAVVLAGGNGTRLQQFLLRERGLRRPKQFCAITGHRSMLRHTIDRISTLFVPARTLTVINQNHLKYAMDDLYDRDPSTLIAVPFNCETAPNILLPLLRIQAIDPDALVTIFPSDHFILQEEQFMRHVRAALSFVERTPEMIVMLGIVPNRVEEGYGWIEQGEPVGDEQGMKFFSTTKFWEKPDPEIRDFLYAQGCLWNTLTMVGSVYTFIRLFKICTPEVYTPFRHVWNAIGTADESRAIYRAFMNLTATNFSRAILERCPHHLSTLPVRGVYWNDWGDERRVRSDLALLEGRQWITPIARADGRAHLN